jgi:hypothetical protein
LVSTQITKQWLTMEHLNTTKASLSMDAHVLATIQKDINYDPMIKCLVSNYHVSILFNIQQSNNEFCVYFWAWMKANMQTFD